jgi:capsular exopolysaccharide synthesis family protein
MVLAQRVGSYSQLMVSGRVLDGAGQRLGSTVDPDEVAAVTPTGSAVFGVMATEADPARAAAVADAVAQSFMQVLGEVERPRGPAGPAAVSSVMLDSAKPADTADSPRPAWNLGAGAVLGLLAAVAVVVLREILSPTVGSTATLLSVTGGTAFGALPTVPARRRRSAAVDADPRFVEGVRRVRAHLTVRGDRPGVLVLAAPTAGTGTSTLVRAVAASMASGRRVLVVDADLRSSPGDDPSEMPSPGLVDVLVGTASPDDAVRHTDGPDLLPAGGTVDDPAELLSDARFAALMVSMRERYDVVLVDTPPLVPAVDAAIVARHADGVVLLCRDGGTTLVQLRSAVSTLHEFGGRIVGAVLTMSDAALRAQPAGSRRPEDAASRAERVADPV